MPGAAVTITVTTEEESIEPAKRWDFDTEDSSFVQNRSVLAEDSPFGGNMLRLNVANAGAEVIYQVDLNTVPSTFSMWISPANGSMAQEQSLLHQKKKNNLISIQSDGHLSTAVTGDVYVSDAAELVEEEKWNHVAVSITPVADSTSTHIMLVLNGKAVMDETVQGMPPDGSDAPGFLLGKHRTDAKYFYGDIDNICFYTKALSESELSAIYTAEAANLPM